MREQEGSRGCQDLVELHPWGLQGYPTNVRVCSVYFFGGGPIGVWFRKDRGPERGSSIVKVSWEGSLEEWGSVKRNGKINLREQQTQAVLKSKE